MGRIKNRLSVIAVFCIAAAMSAMLLAAGCSSDKSATGTTSNQATAASGSASSASAGEKYADMAVGTAVDFKDGMSVRVDSVTPGLVNYDGSEVTQVTVTYTNNGDKTGSFNLFEWKGQDANGAQRSTTYYSEEQNPLNSGELAKGGTVTGNLYFDSPISKVVYEPISLFDDDEYSWVF